MKRLLLSLCLVGAVFPGHTPNLLQITLGPPVKHLIEARAVSPISSPAILSLPEQQRSRVEQTTVRSTMMNQHAQSMAFPKEDNQRASLPTTGDSLEPSAPSVPEGEIEEPNWVVVIRGATVHSGPSVSAPTVRFYSVGTELQLIDYHGWFQVLDPTTSQRGWIYEKYYLQAIRGPGQIIAAQEPAKPQQKVANARQPTPHVRRVKRLGPRPTKRIQPLIASAPRYRYETVASILDKALRP